MSDPVGTVFADVDLRVPEGGILVVHGAPGGGKTSLLLTLAGRMAFTAGSLDVAGRLLPDQRHGVRKATALAEITGVNDLDPLLSIGDHLTERLAGRGWLPWVGSHARDRATGLLTDLLGYAVSAVPAAHASPSLASTTRVRDLAPLERWVLGVTLRYFEILLVDDIDGLRGSDDLPPSAVLASLAGSQVRRTARTQPARALTVVVSCRDLHEATDALAEGGGIPPCRWPSRAAAPRLTPSSPNTPATRGPTSWPPASPTPPTSSPRRCTDVPPRPACRRAAPVRRKPPPCSRSSRSSSSHSSMAGSTRGPTRARRRGSTRSPRPSSTSTSR